MSSTAYAASFGHSRLMSNLGEPLRIDVPVSQLSANDIRTLRVSPAPAAAWKQAGLTPPVKLDSWTIHIVDGFSPSTKVIQISSDQAFNRPVADLLLNVQTASGQQQYQVSILTHGGASPAARLSREQAGQAGAPLPAILIKHGDTLWAIAESHAVSGVTIFQMMVALQRANPAAFIHHNLNLIRTGASLTIPDKAALTAISDREARLIFEKQLQAFRLLRQTVAASVPAIELGGSAAQGQVSPPLQNAPAPEPVTPRDQLKLSSAKAPADVAADQRVAEQKGVADSEGRVSLLEENVHHLNQALQLQGEAAKDAVVEGAKGLGQSLADVAAAVGKIITLDDEGATKTSESETGKTSSQANGANAANGGQGASTAQEAGSTRPGPLTAQDGSVQQNGSAAKSGSVAQSDSAAQGGLATDGASTTQSGATTTQGESSMSAGAAADDGSVAQRQSTTQSNPTAQDGSTTQEALTADGSTTQSGSAAQNSSIAESGSAAQNESATQNGSTTQNATAGGTSAQTPSGSTSSPAPDASASSTEGAPATPDGGLAIDGQAGQQTGPSSAAAAAAGQQEGQGAQPAGPAGSSAQNDKAASGSGDANAPSKDSATGDAGSGATAPSALAENPDKAGTAAGLVPSASDQAAKGSASSDGRAKPEPDVAPRIANGTDQSVSWIQEHLLGVVTGVLALIVLLIAWLLRRANLARDEGPGDHELLVTEAMVKEKLDKINLDLRQAPSDGPDKPDDPDEPVEPAGDGSETGKR